MENVLKPLSKDVLISLGLIGAASATDVAIQKKIHVFETTALITSNEEVKDIMKIVRSLEEFGLWKEDGSKIIEN